MKQLLIFSAPSWCAPCVQLKKELEKISIEYEYIDVDQEPDKAAEYKLRGVPVLIKLQDGKEVDRKTGTMSSSAIEEWFKI